MWRVRAVREDNKWPFMAVAGDSSLSLTSQQTLSPLVSELPIFFYFSPLANDCVLGFSLLSRVSQIHLEGLGWAPSEEETGGGRNVQKGCGGAKKYFT